MSYQLMVFSYRKGLSEEWYSQKVLWVSTFTIYIVLYILNYKHYSRLTQADSLLMITSNFWLLVLMLKTRHRTIMKPRWNREFLLDSYAELDTDWDQGQKIRVSFSRRGTVKSNKSFVVVNNYFYKSEHSSFGTDDSFSQNEERMEEVEPFLHVGINDWETKKAASGEDYIEYELQVTLTENPKYSWPIVKRYHDFQELEEALKPFTPEGVEAPVLFLPPQGDYQNSGFQNLRKEFLEAFMKAVLKTFIG